MTPPSTLRSRAYLAAAGATGLLAFGIPLFLSPLRWASRLRWRVPEDTDLTVYLGRSLGAVAIALSLGALRAVRRPEEHRVMFEVGFLTGVLLAAVHAWGALLRRQPWTETAEIALWSAMAAGAALTYPREKPDRSRLPSA
ncbi:MAG: hypothetical protein WBF37_04055 [Dehalococcoidia bacterium]